MDSFQIAGYAFDQQLALEWAAKIGGAIIIIIITWALAKAAKWTFAKLVDQISFFRRDTSNGESVGMSLGRIVSLFIWLFGLIAVLQRLGFDSVIEPVQQLLGTFIGYIDNIVFAAAIFFVGSMIARIVRDIVETAAATVNLDKWANKGGVETVTGNSAISKTVGTIFYILIIIPVSIAALQMLGISAITDPAMNLLNMVFQAVPLIIGACILLGLGYVIARWVASVIEELLPSLGADRAIASLAILPEGRTASGIIGAITSIAIMLFFAIAATNLLGFPQLTDMLDTILKQAGSVVFGAVLIAFGVLIARILKSLIEGATGAGIAPNAAYWLTVGLFIFIGLQQMNIGGPIIEYAFLTLAIGAAIAFALAFGLGGRDAAAHMLNEFSAGTTPPKTVAKTSVKAPTKTAAKAAFRAPTRRPTTTKSKTVKK